MSTIKVAKNYADNLIEDETVATDVPPTLQARKKEQLLALQNAATGDNSGKTTSEQGSSQKSWINPTSIKRSHSSG